MTLIAAVSDAKSVVIAADSKQISTDNRSGGGTTEKTVDKLIQLGSESVFWGYQGSSEIGEPFRDSINTAMPFKDWFDLTDRCGPELRSLNDIDPRIRAQSRPGTSVLFAGFLNGILDIIEIDQWGTFHPHPGYGFIGWGRLATQVGWIVAGEARSDLIERFRLTMDTVMAEIDGLGGPISAWHITRKGVSRAWPYP